MLRGGKAGRLAKGRTHPVARDSASGEGALRVGLVSPYDFAHPGGVNEHIRCLARQLRSMGHDAWILATSSGEGDGSDDHLIRVGTRVVPVHASGSVARVSVSPGVFWRVKSVLGAMDFDVVHAHEPLVSFVPLAVLRHSHAVNVGTFHAYRESQRGYRVAKPVLEPFMNRLSGRVAVSAASRDLIERYFPGAYTVIPNGIDFQRFANPRLSPPERFRDDRPTVLFVGRLEERKGFEHLLRAFRWVTEAVPRARLVVVGAFDKDDKADHVRYAWRHNVPGVHFVGYVPSSEMPRYFRLADVFCAPSTGFESFGIVLLEAMASGVPIVASDIQGYRGVMTDDEQGCLVPPGDADAIAASLIHLLRLPDERRRMGACGQATARAYAWERVARQVAGFYLELLDRRRLGLDESEREERSKRELVERVSAWFDPR